MWKHCISGTARWCDIKMEKEDGVSCIIDMILNVFIQEDIITAALRQNKQHPARPPTDRLQ